MQKLRAGLILMIIIVALASWYKNQKREQAAALIDTSAVATPAPRIEIDALPMSTPAPASAPTATPAPSSQNISPENLELVRACLAKDPALAHVRVSNAQTLRDVIRSLSPSVTSARISLHVRRANGQEERILMQPHDPTSKQTYKIGTEDLRVFAVDNEGLPIAKEFPRELKADSIGQAMTTFVGTDPITFRENRTQYTFDGGLASSVETNGSINELQINFGRKTLGCAWQKEALNCACL